MLLVVVKTTIAVFTTMNDNDNTQLPSREPSCGCTKLSASLKSFETAKTTDGEPDYQCRCYEYGCVHRTSHLVGRLKDVVKLTILYEYTVVKGGDELPLH